MADVPDAGGGSGGAAADDGASGSALAVLETSAPELGFDELRCVFAALLTLKEPMRDLGRYARGQPERPARAGACQGGGNSERGPRR